MSGYVIHDSTDPRLGKRMPSSVLSRHSLATCQTKQARKSVTLDWLTTTLDEQDQS